MFDLSILKKNLIQIVSSLNQNDTQLSAVLVKIQLQR